ncbi:MAG: hypothetical protein QXZ30_01800 [Candidatus Bilamarchaeaceae archaeon]
MICTQKTKHSDKLISDKFQRYNEIRKKVEFAEKFLEALKLVNNLYHSPNPNYDPQKRAYAISNCRRLMEESLQLQ